MRIMMVHIGSKCEHDKDNWKLLCNIYIKTQGRAEIKIYLYTRMHSLQTCFQGRTYHSPCSRVQYPAWMCIIPHSYWFKTNGEFQNIYLPTNTKLDTIWLLGNPPQKPDAAGVTRFHSRSRPCLIGRYQRIRSNIPAEEPVWAEGRTVQYFIPLERTTIQIEWWVYLFQRTLMIYISIWSTTWESTRLTTLTSVQIIIPDLWL